MGFQNHIPPKGKHHGKRIPFLTKSFTLVQDTAQQPYPIETRIP